MKCSNCGFESNSKYCPKCGMELPHRDDNPPYANNVNENRGFVNGDGFYTPNTGNNSGQFGFDMNQPQQLPPSAFQPNQPGYQPPTYVQPQKSGKALPIIICSIIGFVVIVIAAMLIISFNINNNPDSIVGVYDDFAYSLADGTENYRIYSDNGNIHQLGETFECPVAKVDLKDVRQTSIVMSDDYYRIYTVTFEFENTTAHPMYLDVYSNALQPETFEYCDDVEYLYTDSKSYSNYDGCVLKAGEKAEFVEYFKAPKDGEDVVFEFCMSDRKDYAFDISAMYEVDLSDYAENNQETTK